MTEMTDDLGATLVDIKSLTPDPANARKHSPRNLQAIAKSLSAFGQRRPLLITEANFVIAGNGTLEAAKSLGWKQISVTKLPHHWDEAQIRAYAIADNRTAELAVWDEDVLLESLDALGSELADWAGFNAAEVDKLLGADLYADKAGSDGVNEGNLTSGDEVIIKVGAFRFAISRDHYEEWLVEVRAEGGHSDEQIKASIMTRLGL